LASSLARLEASVSVPTHLPEDCIPGQQGAQIQLGAYATFAGSLSIVGPYGPEASAQVSGDFCGTADIVEVPPIQCAESLAVELNIPADGQDFNLPGVDISLVPGITPEVTDTHIIAEPIHTLICVSNTPGAIKLDLSVSVSTAASLFGATCIVGPVTLPLTGVLFGPLSGFTFQLRSSSFGIPVANPTVDCPSNVTSQLNQLLDFPLSPGASTVSLSGNGTAYYAPKG
jgi:hypothetical protein